MIYYIQQLLRMLKRLRKEAMPRVILLTLLTMLVGTIGIHTFEFMKNDNIGTIWDALWWSFVTITTVGYGDIFPVTTGGRITAVFVMLMGIGFLGMFTATVASIFVEDKLKENQGRKSVTSNGHTIICGWNFRAKDIYHELRAAKTAKNMDIVLIADLEEKPIDDPDLYFIKGQVTEDNLRKASLGTAINIIILADDRLDPRSRDAKTILDTLTVESVHPDIYSCVEIENSENVAHCRRAHANEIIVSGEFSSKLLARAALQHGISKLIDELLSSRYGAFLVKTPVRKDCIGTPFMDYFVAAKKEENQIIVAVVSADDANFISNPPTDYVFQDGDFIIGISQNQQQL
ncbi:ion transporter [bacterium]|nr:ion transporter [bacterium]